MNTKIVKPKIKASHLELILVPMDEQEYDRLETSQVDIWLHGAKIIQKSIKRREEKLLKKETNILQNRYLITKKKTNVNYRSRRMNSQKVSNR